MTDALIWIEKEALLLFHDESLAQFGGAPGIRDPGLLESALSRPRNKLHYEPATSVFRLASAYCFGIAKNHPFLDGNKRAAFLSTYVFLRLNGLELSVDPIEAELVVIELVEDRMTEDDVAEWLKDHCA